MRCAATAAEIRTICTKAGVPSCIRVPPLTGAATSGRPSRVARSMPATIRSAAARPIDPARKPNSPTSTAIRRPCIRASPVSTDSSTPDFSAAAASSAAYASLTPSRVGAVSQEDHEPSSRTRSMRSWAERRAMRGGYASQVHRRDVVPPQPAGTPGAGVRRPMIQRSKNADSSRPVSFSQWS